MINGIEDLVKACGRKTVEVEIKGTDIKIQLQELSVQDRSDHFKLAREHEDDFHFLAAFLVARACPQLTDEDAPRLREEIGGDAVEALSLEVCRISGMLPESIEEEVKN